MGKTVAITGVNSYFALTILPRLEADPEIEQIIGIDVTPWRGGFGKVRFYKEDVRNERIAEIPRPKLYAAEWVHLDRRCCLGYTRCSRTQYCAALSQTLSFAAPGHGRPQQQQVSHC